MNLRTKQAGKILIFEVEGHIDFESTQQLQQTCQEIIAKRKIQKIIFNMNKLRFVGSSGINYFLKILSDFNASPLESKYCELSTEFQKVFKALTPSLEEKTAIFPSEKEAIQSFLSCSTEEMSINTSLRISSSHRKELKQNPIVPPTLEKQKKQRFSASIEQTSSHSSKKKRRISN